MGRSRTATLALLRRLPETLIQEPHTQGIWSIQDVLVHVAAWEAEGARRLELIGCGRADGLVFYDTMPEVDAFNARAVRAARATSLRGVRVRLARARTRLVDALRRLPPEALADPAHDLPVTRWLREFAWTHEGAHRREIQAWWRARGRAGRRAP